MMKELLKEPINSDTKKYFGGSKEATEENLHFFAAKLQELNQSNTRYTFRQWLNRTMNLLDLID